MNAIKLYKKAINSYIQLPVGLSDRNLMKIRATKRLAYAKKKMIKKYTKSNSEMYAIGLLMSICAKELRGD